MMAAPCAASRWQRSTNASGAPWRRIQPLSLVRRLHTYADDATFGDQWQSPDQAERLIAAKGAPECHRRPLPTSMRRRALPSSTQVHAMAATVCACWSCLGELFLQVNYPTSSTTSAFEFLGLIALEDPVRPDRTRAIAECHAAGIRVVMMTGDHPATAVRWPVRRA